MAESYDTPVLSADVIRRLIESGKFVATAESCTGGWIAKALTDIAGSSAAFAYGIVSYSNDAKESVLGVAPETLLKHGAVSEATVIDMAEGVIELSGADLSVAVSGIAGPDGGSDDKPVGTVWFAWAVRSGDDVQTSTDRQCFAGDRDDVRRQTVLHALAGLQERLQE